MRSAILIGLVLSLVATPAAAISEDECYLQSKSYLAALLDGRFQRLAEAKLMPPEDWPGWIARQFPGSGPFKSFCVVETADNGDGCQARIRLTNRDGDIYVLFIDLDDDGRLTGMQTLADLLHLHDRDVGALDPVIAALLKEVGSAGTVDDVDLIPVLVDLRNRLDAAERTITGQPPVR